MESGNERIEHKQSLLLERSKRGFLKICYVCMIENDNRVIGQMGIDIA